MNQGCAPMNVREDMGCGSSAKAPAGFAAKERLFNEIQNLKDAVFQLSAKLDPISFREPSDGKPLRAGGSAHSEYFQSIFEAANMVEDIRDVIVAMHQEVEL